MENNRGHGATTHHPVPSLIHCHTANPLASTLGKEVGEGKRGGRGKGKGLERISEALSQAFASFQVCTGFLPLEGSVDGRPINTQ